MNTPPRYKKVMVIDDSEVDRYIARRNMEKCCFAEEVIMKESAESALEYLQSLADTPHELPQLIFLDIRMPEIDGFEFLERYSKLSEAIKATCIVMMLTSSLSPGDHEKAKSNRYVKRFLNKPLDKDKFDLLNASIEQNSKPSV